MINMFGSSETDENNNVSDNNKNKISKKDKKKKIRTTMIGGQAVMEGVMMRGASSMATCCRDQDGIMRLETERFTPVSKKKAVYRIPIIRGVINFVSSMVMGMKTLMRSAEVFGDSEPGKFEKWLSEKFKIDLMGIITFFSLILGLALAIGLFMVLPTFLTGLFIDNAKHQVAFTLVEGLIKLLIFIGYIALVSLMKDIRRTFMYHGAEHKTINCYESGLDMTVENVRKSSRVHNRCGTTFIFFVVFVSIIVFCLFNMLPFVNFSNDLSGKLLRILTKLLLLPLVAGLSYELLKGLAKTNNPIFYPLKAPGLLLQRLTTKEPTDDMIEVGICAFQKVLQMEADPNEPQSKFVTTQKLSVVLEETKKQFAENNIDESDAEWIVSIAAKIKRDDLSIDKSLSPRIIDEINRLKKERLSGKPLWQIIGDTDFYGYKIFVDENVLTPRPETEELVKKAVEDIKETDTVLDLCTGSGAIAIAVKKLTGADVTASDISEKALLSAKKSATENQAEIKFIQSDLFEGIEGKFSVIISNPPYIPSAEIEKLDREVKNFEPRIALDGGDDGLVYYRKICTEAPKYLYPGGMLYFEIGEEQGQAVLSMLGSFTKADAYKDINGKDRIIKAVL